ncbi:MAPEG family protein [Methylopila henanensis]|uniref:MAPEG family protein n=1 Tax=Methylopila henanensis TaxID=873516 RepID=A0ABW4K8H6_9HYPH
MTVQAILAPLFAQVLLTFALMIWMAQTRFAAARAGKVTPNKGSPRTFGWPEKAQQVADSFHNQLELPPLFYVLVTLALVTKEADLLFVAMSWAFVASRYVHAYVHTGRNRTMTRFRCYFVGALILLAMWAIFAIRILAA